MNLPLIRVVNRLIAALFLAFALKAQAQLPPPDVYARLRTLVREIPRHWSSGSPPASDRTAPAPDCELGARSAGFSRPPNSDRTEAASAAEAGLIRAESCRSLKLLFSSAGDAAEVLIARGDLPSLAGDLAAWESLPGTPAAAAGHAAFELQRGDLFLRLFQGEKALAVAGQARDLARQAGDVRTEGRARGLASRALLLLARNQESLATAEEALRTTHEAGDAQGEGTARRVRAANLSSLGRNAEALEALDATLPLVRAAADTLGEGLLDLGKEQVLTRLDRKEEAAAASAAARRLFRSVGDPWWEANAFFGEAQALAKLGRNEAALGAYEEAACLFEASGSLPGKGRVRFSEASFLNALGRPEEALAAAVESGAIRRLTGSPPADLLQPLLIQGEALAKLGRSSESLLVLAEVEAIQETLPDSAGRCWVLSQEADLFTTTQRFAEAARASFDASLCFEVAGDRERGVQQGLLASGNLARLGRYDAALAGVERLEPELRALTNRLVAVQFLGLKGEILANLGRLREALAAYVEAAERSEAAGGLASAIHLRKAGLALSLGLYTTALEASREAFRQAQLQADKQTEGQAKAVEAEALTNLGMAGDHGLDAFRVAQTLATEAGDRQTEAEARVGVAQALSALGRHDEAATEYRLALQAFQAAGDAGGETKVAYGEAHDLFSQYAFDRALKRLADAMELFRRQGTDLGQSRAWLLKAEILVALDRVPEALPAHEEALCWARRSGVAREELFAQASKANALARLGRFEEAQEAVHAALRLAESSGDRRGKIGAYTVLGETLSHVSRFEEARDALARASRLAREEGDSDAETRALFDLASVLSQESRLGEAEAALHEAHLALTPGNLGYQARIRAAEAELALEEGHVAESGEAFAEAQILLRKAGLDADAMSLRRADELIVLTRPVEALKLYREVRQHAAGAGRESQRAQAQLGEARVFGVLRQGAEAATDLQEALGTCRRIHDPVCEANVDFVDGRLAGSLGSGEEALKYYGDAQALYSAAGLVGSEASTLVGEAEAYFTLSRYPEALAKASEALTMARAIEDSWDARAALRIRARLLLQLGRGDEALQAAREASAVRSGTSTDFERYEDLETEGAVLGQVRQPEAAVARAYEALGLLSSMRTNFPDRLIFDTSLRGVYDTLIPALVDVGRADEALARADEARSRILFERLAGSPVAERPSSGPAGDVTARRNDLQRQEAALAARLTQSAYGASAELFRQQRALDIELDRMDFDSLLGAEKPLTSPAALDAAQLRAIAETSGPVVLFYSAEREILVFVLAPGRKLAVVRLPLQRDAFASRVIAFLDDLANSNYAARADEEAHALWRDLFAPLADLLPSSGPLVLIPNYALHWIPFEALLDEQGRRFFERYDYATVPSIAILGELRKRHRSPSPEDAALTLSTGHELDAVYDETRRLGGLFGSARWVGLEHEAATAEAYREKAHAARQLFIASHGVYDPAMERRTFFEVSPSAEHDNRLSALEIAAIPIDAELVTLAACDTGTSSVYFSDERLDLARAFLIAGAATVLATRWRVPDDARTSRFLSGFYSLYLGGQRKDRALAETRRRSVRRGDPAEVWAAWVLTGDPR